MFEDAMKYDLLIFDCDGTIRVSKSGRVVPNSPDDIAILPQAKTFFDRLRMCQSRPHIGLCSNQMGVGQRYAAEQWLPTAMGNFAKWCEEMIATRPTEAEMLAVMLETASKVGADECVMCCYWPPKQEGGENRPRPENPYLPFPHDESGDLFMEYEGRWSSVWRKPNSGMLQWLMSCLMRTPDSPRPYTLMVGNGDEDRQAAANAGVEFMDAAAFWELVNAKE